MSKFLVFVLVICLTSKYPQVKIAPKQTFVNDNIVPEKSQEQ